MKLRPLLILVVVIMVIGAMNVCLVGTSRAANLSLFQPYAWYGHAPGQTPNAGPHYLDDSGPVGPHRVHLPPNSFGAFGLGELTDGVIQSGGAGGAGQAALAQWGNAPAADLIFDLSAILLVEEIVIGTHVTAGANNNPPDDVSISYSTTGTDPGDFGSATLFDLEAMFGPLADGHHDMALPITPGAPARYVKLSFDGGSMTEPGGQDPDEKWMLDEITINGTDIPEPTTLLLATLGLLGLLAFARRRRWALYSSLQKQPAAGKSSSAARLMLKHNLL